MTPGRRGVLSPSPSPSPSGHSGPLSVEQVNAAVRSFTLLADPTRVRMLWALRDEDLDVATLAAARVNL
jgi:hypothetical protein